MNARCPKDAEGAPEVHYRSACIQLQYLATSREREREERERERLRRRMVRNGEGLRGGQEFLIFLEASSATISREQWPNKLSQPHPPCARTVLRWAQIPSAPKAARTHARTHARALSPSLPLSLSMPPCLPLSLVRPEAALPVIFIFCSCKNK